MTLLYHGSGDCVYIIIIYNNNNNNDNNNNNNNNNNIYIYIMTLYYLQLGTLESYFTNLENPELVGIPQ